MIINYLSYWKLIWTENLLININKKLFEHEQSIGFTNVASCTSVTTTFRQLQIERPPISQTHNHYTINMELSFLSLKNEDSLSQWQYGMWQFESLFIRRGLQAGRERAIINASENGLKEFLNVRLEIKFIDNNRWIIMEDFTATPWFEYHCRYIFCSWCIRDELLCPLISVNSPPACQHHLLQLDLSRSQCHPTTWIWNNVSHFPQQNKIYISIMPYQTIYLASYSRRSIHGTRV